MNENETVNQENSAAGQAEQETRTFTQSEMNAIIQDRLARERSKYADYEALKAKADQFDAAEQAGKSELQRATERAEALQRQLDELNRSNTIQAARAAAAAATGVPAELLTGESEEVCTAQAEAILRFARPAGYPDVQDGGESDARRRERQGDGVLAAFGRLNPNLKL